VIDLSDVKATDSSNHSKFAQLADVAPQLTAVLARGVGASSQSKEDQPGNGTLENIVAMLGVPIKIIWSMIEQLPVCRTNADVALDWRCAGVLSQTN
jgi:esterase/lipase superfamily enzyme